MLVTNDNIDLVRLLASLSIKKTIIEPIIKIVEAEADYELFLGKRLLNREVYLSVILISKKQHRTFCGFQYSEKIIHKYNGISYWLCSFCKAVNIMKIFSTTLIV